MSIPRRASAVGTAIAVSASAITALSSTASATTPTYTVTVGTTTTAFTHPDDTPASVFTDKDGTFYYQESHSLYGATASRAWSFYSGTNFDTATANSTINSQTGNADTTSRCDNSPTGLNATSAPAGSSYSQRNFCDLLGVWVDPDTGAWYGLVHNEFTPQPFNDGWHYDAIDYAESTDQGKTWTIEGHAITSPYSTTRGDRTAFPNTTYDYGDGDPRLFVDYASGYFYVFYGSRAVDMNASTQVSHAHVARAPISKKMATGSWQKWYNGTWTEPGVGGKESNMVPVTSSTDTGYTAPADDYNPANTGSVATQIANGTMPSRSPLIIMSVAYDPYLGLYIGEPGVVNHDTPQPQQFYATSDLSTQKWTLLGDSGSYQSDSWYRWLLDSANLTSSTFVGKSFRSYCAVSCSSAHSSGEYYTTTITPSSLPVSPVDPAKLYKISGGGRVLAQVPGGSATTSAGTFSGTGWEAWKFTATGDGAYTVTNASSGKALSVDSTTTTNRAWGTTPTVSTLGTSPTVGQQWWLIHDTTDNGYRLVNRYSGLTLALTPTPGQLAETTPFRSWDDTSTTNIGAGRTSTQQTLSLTPVTLTGKTISESGMRLTDPNSSTANSTHLTTNTAITGAANQTWVLQANADGTYQIANTASDLCLANGNTTTAGAPVIQYACSAGDGQKWTLTQQPNGTYTLTSKKSGLLLTTASTANGAAVTQQTADNTALQQWTIM